jgi:hypothetical protein
LLQANVSAISKYEIIFETQFTMQKRFLQKTSQEWEDILDAAGISCSRINTISQAFASNQVLLFIVDLFNVFLRHVHAQIYCTGVTSTNGAASGPPNSRTYQAGWASCEVERDTCSHHTPTTHAGSTHCRGVV